MFDTYKLWTYFTPCYSVSFVNFEHLNASWESVGTHVNDFVKLTKESIKQISIKTTEKLIWPNKIPLGKSYTVCTELVNCFLWSNWPMKAHYRSQKIVFYALFLCGHYFIQYGFIQVCIFYLFFGKTIFFVFTACSDFNELFINFCNICNHYLYSRCQVPVFILSYHFSIKQFVRTDTRHKNLIIALIKTCLYVAFEI